MRFSLRCIFFLSIVYGAILRHDGLLPELSAPVAPALFKAQTSVERRLVDGMGTVCAGNPGACLAGAARLSRLLVPAADAASRVGPRSDARGGRGAVGPISH